MSFFTNICGASLSRVSGTGVTSPAYSIESEASFSYFTGTNELSTTEKNEISKFIDSQVRIGNWSKIKEIQLNSGVSTSDKALIGLKQGITGINNGATYNPLTGFTSNGTTSYVNTNLVPTTLGSSLNDAGFLAHIIENLGVARVGALGTNTAHQSYFAITKSTGVYNGNINGSGTNYTNTKMKLDDVTVAYKRDTLGILSIMYDGQYIGGSNSNNATGVPNTAIYLGATNIGGPSTFSASRYGAAMIYDAIGFDDQGFQFYFGRLLIALGVRTADSLFSDNATSYSDTDALLVHSEGQSNSLFSGKATGTTKYPNLDNPIVGANIMWMPTLGSDVAIETLTYKSNHNLDSSLALTNGDFAGGMRMAYELANIQLLKQYIWAYCKSATTLYNDGTAQKDWNVDSVNELNFESKTYVGAKGIPQITEPIKKLVWHWNQGEGDAGLPRTESEYTTDLYKLLNDRIVFYEAQGINLSVTDFHVMFHKIWLGGVFIGTAGRDAIRAAQDNFSIHNFEAAYPAQAGKIKTMVTYNTDNYIRSDDVHLMAHGYHLEGYRVANYISKL